MESQYTYQARAQFHQPSNSFVEWEHGTPRTIHFSAPPEFGGESGKWTPEHFLLAAVASCFIETFRSVARASRLEFQGLEVIVDGILEKDTGGLRFTRVAIHPALIVYSEQARELGVRLLEKTERICLVVRSLSAQITMDPKVLIEAAVTA
jgi:uncharacterized OsmC-like protein